MTLIVVILNSPSSILLILPPKVVIKDTKIAWASSDETSFSVKYVIFLSVVKSPTYVFPVIAANNDKAEL